jgi:Domain of unknown function (DUF927)
MTERLKSTMEKAREVSPKPSPNGAGGHAESANSGHVEPQAPSTAKVTDAWEVLYEKQLLEILKEDEPLEKLFRAKSLLAALAGLQETDPATFHLAKGLIRNKGISASDFDKVIHSFRRQSHAPAGSASPYSERDGIMYRDVLTDKGPVPVALCNFTARIVADVEHDDGVESRRSLAIDGTLWNKRPLGRAEVNAADFASMNWVIDSWGTQAVVYAGQGIRDHLRAALQLLSGDVPKQLVFEHLGWRQVGGQWVYLHAGGAIGAHGLIEDMPVSLPDALAGFRLPAPPEGSELMQAVRASLDMLKLGLARLLFPMLAATYRAALGETDFGMHLVGPTGSFKSEAATLAQQHFGRAMSSRRLPASWASTANANEALAFAAKDSLLVVDDFSPTGSSADVQRLQKDAERLFRAQGNRSGRQRMKANAELRSQKPPRGLILSTGEDTPAGQSLRARLLVLEASRGDLGPIKDNPVLTSCQRDADAGKYEAAMAAFIQWLAPDYDRVRTRLPAEMAELRSRVGAAGQHARTPGIVADLALGLRYFLDFACDSFEVSDAERGELWERGWDALIEAAEAHTENVGAAEPAALFLRLLGAALASGSAHIADEAGNAPDEAGNAPDEPQRWGWRRNESSGRYEPKGSRVGWLMDGQIYLEPDASFAAVQCGARDQGQHFPIAERTTRKRLKEQGYLAATDEARERLTVRRVLQGKERAVLHLAPGAL